VGARLTADPGSWSDPTATLTYAWLRCDESGLCERVDGATGATYEVTAADLGSSLLLEVTASNGGGARKADSALTGIVVPALPSVVTGPTISGDPSVGSTLTADPGTWSDPIATFTYAWQRCHGNGSGSCTTIEEADGTTYVLTDDDVGYRIAVTVTATNAGGSGSADSNLVGPIVPQAPPAVITPPSVSGDPSVGSTLTADPGTWSDPTATFTYSWLRCDVSSACTTITGADGTTYTLTSDDLAFLLCFEVTAANAGGAVTARSAPTAPVEPAAQTSATAGTTPPGSP